MPRLQEDGMLLNNMKSEEVMRRKGKLLAFVISAVLMLGTVSGLVGCVKNDDPVVEKPAPVYKVYSVTLRYNDANVDGGIINVDLSAGSIQLGANVRKDDGADGTVTYESSETSVATIDAQGKVTLISAGETIISATAGGKSHRVVLAVSDDYKTAESHSITVNGGTASVTAAEAGEYVTLTAEIPQHMDFIEWQFDGEDEIWTNGNVFRMPDRDIVITADYDEMLYTLNVVGASVTKADEVVTPEGEDGGNTQGGASADYDMTVYKFSFETEISLEAIEAPEGKMFIGWDYGTVNNRVGQTGNPEYGPFTMPDSTLTVWAVFSDLQTKVWTPETGPYNGEAITDGMPAGDFADPDLEGLSGYRFSISPTQSAVSQYNENITGSDFTTSDGQSKTLKAILKNHHAMLSVTIELYITYYGNVVTSGNLTIGPGETITHYFQAGLGIDDPWWGMEVREDVGGTGADGNIQLDVVLGCAATYPSGDKLLQISGDPQYVHVGDYDTNGSSWDGNRPKIVYNDLGLSNIAIYGGNFNNKPDGYISAPIQNMPEYDPANPTTTVYIRLINNVTNQEEPLNTLAFAIGTDKDPTDGEGPQFDRTENVTITKIGEIILLKLEITRTPDDGGRYYFSIIKPVIDVNDSYWGHNFCVQLTFNNVMGYEEAAL